MKRILTISGAALGLLILILILIPLLVSGNTFRPKLEDMASQALGRKVQIGNLDFSLFSGSLRADNLSIADDPRFSQSPFLTASSLKIGVKVWPLITSKQLDVTGITIDKPVVHLISNSANQWNYSTLANTGNSAPSQPHAQQTNNLTVAKLDVTNGEVTMAHAGVTAPSVYNNVQMETTNFSLTSAFPVTLSHGSTRRRHHEAQRYSWSRQLHRRDADPSRSRRPHRLLRHRQKWSGGASRRPQRHRRPDESPERRQCESPP